MSDVVGLPDESQGSGLQNQTPAWLYGAMIVAAIGGGWTAVAIAIVPSLGLDWSFWILLFFAAPFYEEALKPLGVYYVFLAWPHIALSRWQIVGLAAIGGLTFALLESYMYVERFPEGGADYVLFRFTAPVFMHVVTSSLTGAGLTPGIFGQLWRGRVPASTRRAYFTAVAVHTIYNVTVLLLAVIGVREFIEQTDR